MFEYIFVKGFGIGLLIISVILIIMFAAGAFASTDYYMVKRCLVTSGTPNNNVYYNVCEIRKFGEDRNIFSTNNIDEAIRVMKEFDGINMK